MFGLFVVLFVIVVFIVCGGDDVSIGGSVVLIVLFVISVF